MAITDTLGYARYTFTLGTDGELAVTGHHFRDAHAATDQRAQDVAVHARDVFCTEMGPMAANFSGAVKLRDVTVYYLQQSSPFHTINKGQVAAIPGSHEFNGTGTP